MRPMQLALLLGGVAAACLAQDVYRPQPTWSSSDHQRSTGAALVDLNLDGWPDFVVANGNDMAQQHVVVYSNYGYGGFPPAPDWESSDIAYNGHLDVADVNGDGWPDVAVAVLGTGSVVSPAVKLYLNNAGTLSAAPDWESTQVANAFGCAFGDVNNDGRPDLAVATGWSYGTPHRYHNSVHLNVAGALEATPSWQSDDTWDYQGVLWVDANEDGWLDLVGVPCQAETQIYINQGGALETTASWQTTDAGGQDAIMAAAGDVNGDGWRELFVTDNTQLGGSGRLRQYTGLPGGYFETTYSWSHYENYGSSVALGDLDGDGLLDMAAGSWWGQTHLFLNDGAGFADEPNWISSRSSVVEKIVFADVDGDGLWQAQEAFPADGRQLFYLAHQPVQEIVAVRVDGVTLGPDACTYNREFGWVAVGVVPSVGVEIEYTYSTLLDMAITTWDSNQSNYIYMNILGCPGDVNHDGHTNVADLGILLAQYGCTADCSADLDGDDDVDLSDLGILLADYGCL